MRLKRFRIKNYRSFVEESELSLADNNVLIGPNNVGKTNFLLAIEAFFGATERENLYNYRRDFPKHVAAGRTTMVAGFVPEHNEDDAAIVDRYDTIRRKGSG